MAYGTLKVDNITYTSGGSDASTTVSGLVNGNFPNISITGTISGATITGNTADFTTITAVTGIFTTTLSGATVTGATAQFTTLTGGTAGFTTVTGQTVTGTAGQFGTVTGNTAGFTTITGTTVTGTAGEFGTVTGNTAGFTTVTGTTITGTDGQFGTVTGNTAGFTTVTGTTVTGTTSNFVSGVFTTQISGAGLQVGGSGVFASGIRPSGFLSEKTIIVSGTVASNSGIRLGSGMAYYFLSGETSNATPNFIFDDSTTLDSQMAIGSTVAATLILTPSTTGYAGSMSIDGATANRTLRWQGGTAVTGGTASGLDVYSYQIVKTASNTFAVFVSRANFA